jgi:aminobenzoyl-glutamate utilization protein B
VRFFVGRPMLAALEPGFRYPDWAMNALGGCPAAIDPMTAVAGRTIASTAIDLLTEPAHLAAIRGEFERRTGGGIGGSDWLPPFFDAKTPPPVDYRWPEYVTTTRGEEWCIPVQGEGIERIEG